MIIVISGICIIKFLKAAFILFVVIGDYPSKYFWPDCDKLNNDAPKTYHTLIHDLMEIKYSKSPYTCFLTF